MTRLGYRMRTDSTMAAVVEAPTRTTVWPSSAVRCTIGVSGWAQVADEVVAHALGEVGHLVRGVDQPLEIVRRQLRPRNPLWPNDSGIQHVFLGREVGEVARRLSAARVR